MIVSFRKSFAASIAIVSTPTLCVSPFGRVNSFAALPVSRISIGFIICPPPNFGSDSPAVICTSSVLWWSTCPAFSLYVCDSTRLTASAIPSLILSVCHIPFLSTISISFYSIGF